LAFCCFFDESGPAPVTIALRDTPPAMIASSVHTAFCVMARSCRTALHRGESGKRQVDGANLGLAPMMGAGSVCVIHILEREN